LIGKQQVQRRQHQTAACRQHHGVAHGSAGILLPALAQREADEGAAAVTDHDGDGQRHHSQGKDHRISGISVGTQIAGVGDEDLIHDVVERPYQQGDDAGEGVAAHEPPDGLGLQKLCVVFHRCVLSFGMIKCVSPGNPDLRISAARFAYGIPQKTCGASATGFTQKRHTL